MPATAWNNTTSFGEIQSILERLAMIAQTTPDDAMRHWHYHWAEFVRDAHRMTYDDQQFLKRRFLAFRELILREDPIANARRQEAANCAHHAREVLRDSRRCALMARIIRKRRASC